MKDMMGLMKQAQEMQQKMQDAQEMLDTISVEGSSGGGAVKVVFSGKGEAKSVSIDPELLNSEEVEILEDLIVAAINDVRARVETEAQKRMQDAMGGMGGLAGMFGGKMPF